MDYSVVRKEREIAGYIGDSKLVALDIETSPTAEYCWDTGKRDPEIFSDATPREQRKNNNLKHRSRHTCGGSPPALDAHKSKITGISFQFQKVLEFTFHFVTKLA